MLLTVLYGKKLGQMCQVLDVFLTSEWTGGGETRSGDFQIADFKPNGGWKAAAVSRACTVSAQKGFFVMSSPAVAGRHLSLLASEARIPAANSKRFLHSGRNDRKSPSGRRVHQPCS